MCFPDARRSKYSTIPTPAFAVHEPSSPWSSIGGHHSRRSTLAGRAGRCRPLPLRRDLRPLEQRTHVLMLGGVVSEVRVVRQPAQTRQRQLDPSDLRSFFHRLPPCPTVRRRPDGGGPLRAGADPVACSSLLLPFLVLFGVHVLCEHRPCVRRDQTPRTTTCPALRCWMRLHVGSLPDRGMSGLAPRLASIYRWTAPGLLREASPGGEDHEDRRPDRGPCPALLRLPRGLVGRDEGGGHTKARLVRGDAQPRLAGEARRR